MAVVIGISATLAFLKIQLHANIPAHLKISTAEIHTKAVASSSRFVILSVERADVGIDSSYWIVDRLTEEILCEFTYSAPENPFATRVLYRPASGPFTSVATVVLDEDNHQVKKVICTPGYGSYKGGPKLPAAATKRNPDKMRAK
ncbi:MAG: hypothetical protein ACE5EC_10340, partial [Phycisphaerae bacterium]